MGACVVGAASVIPFGFAKLISHLVIHDLYYPMQSHFTPACHSNPDQVQLFMHGAKTQEIMDEMECQSSIIKPQNLLAQSAKNVFSAAWKCEIKLGGAILW